MIVQRENFNSAKADGAKRICHVSCVTLRTHFLLGTFPSVWRIHRILSGLKLLVSVSSFHLLEGFEAGGRVGKINKIRSSLFFVHYFLLLWYKNFNKRVPELPLATPLFKSPPAWCVSTKVRSFFLFRFLYKVLFEVLIQLDPVFPTKDSHVFSLRHMRLTMPHIFISRYFIALCSAKNTVLLNVELYVIITRK